MYPKITLILLAATACGCSPLREMHSDRRTDIRIADSTLTERIRQEFERQLATLRQTVVEFYPPVQWPPSSEEKPILPPDTLDPLLPPPKIPATSRPAVRRIIHTEAIAAHDRTTLSDSISRSRILAAARNDEQTALEERPNPTGTSWLKWTAACLLLVLLILLWLKLR